MMIGKQYAAEQIKKPFCAQKIQEMHVQFIKSIKPYIDLKIKIYTASMPITLIYKDRVETKYNFTTEQQDQLNKIDSQIEFLKDWYEQRYRQNEKY